jgi:hypothetical protein
MTTSPDLIPQRYIRLALGIEQHIPGYVDAYFGPPEWRDQAEKRSVTELVSEASDLAKALARDTEMSVFSLPGKCEQYRPACASFKVRNLP